jgi:DNA-binding SARP family transcriptional activator
MDARWRIELLGRLRAVQGDRVLTRFRTLKTRSLLAYLAYDLQRPHPREELIEMLWPESDLDAGRGNLSTALHSLRR